MLARVQRARWSVGALREALLTPSPEQISGCLPALEESVSALRQLERELDSERNPQTRRELRAALSALAGDLRIARRLIEHGAALYQGWANLLAAAAGGYVASGQPAPLTAPGTLSLEG